MRVLLLNTYYMYGGAGRAAGRLHQALCGMDVDAHMLVQHNYDPRQRSIYGPSGALEQGAARLKPALEMLPLLLYPGRNRLPFSVNYLPDAVLSHSLVLDPDVINLHWVNTGFLRIETLQKLRKPLVWTLHDSWPFTGGCHIPLDCRRYAESCGRCPALGSRCEGDLSRWIWRRKAKALRGADLTVVTPSRWLARCAAQSSLFRELRIEVIPNGLDLRNMQLLDKPVARRLLGLSADKKYILFGSLGSTSDRNKGFQHLAPALKALAAAGFGTDCELIVFGAEKPLDPPDFGLKAHYLGYFRDEARLNQLYGAADLFVAPSLQENLPNTIMEAMACGTPCVAFDVGGIPDLIEHKANGYLAQPYQAESLAQGIAWVLKGEVGCTELARAARAKVASEFSIEACAGKYLKLYQELAAGGKGTPSPC